MTYRKNMGEPHFPPDPPLLLMTFNQIRAAYWESYYRGYSQALKEVEESSKVEPEKACPDGETER